MPQTITPQCQSILKRSLCDILQEQEERIKIFIQDFDTLRTAQIENPLVPSFLDLVEGFEEGLARFAEAVEAFAEDEVTFLEPFTGLVASFASQLEVIAKIIDRSLPCRTHTTAFAGNDAEITGERTSPTRQASLPQLLFDRIIQFNSLITDFGNDIASAGGLTLLEREELLKSFEDLIQSLEDLIKSFQEVLRTEADLAFADAQAAISVSKNFEDLLKSFEDLANSQQDLKFKKQQQQEELRKSNEDLLKSFEDLIKSFNELVAGPLQKREELLSEIGNLASEFGDNIKKV